MEKIKRAYPKYFSPNKTYYILDLNDLVRELTFKKQTAKQFEFYDVKRNETLILRKNKKYDKREFYHTKKDAYLKLCHTTQWRIDYYQYLLDFNQPHIAYSKKGLANKIDESKSELEKYSLIIKEL